MLFGAALALSAASARAEGGPPMLTDDPGTPGDGRWEINLAVLSEHSGATTTYEAPLVDINYGLGDRLQLKFEVPWLWQDASRHEERSGLGNGVAGVKWRFYDGGDDAWQISTYPQVESGFVFPRSSHHGLTDGGTSYLLPLEFQHGFGGVVLGFEVGRWLRPAQQADTWIAGVVIGHEVRKGLELVAELHDESALGLGGDELVVNFGARWDWSDRLTLLLSAGSDLHNGLGEKNSALTYVGLQVHL